MTEADQEVKNIKIKDLVLWTENPRDLINENADDQSIIDRALVDTTSKWNLTKLAKDMGDYYDLSELPTVVYHNKKPVVYDGNRRIILGKIKHKFVVIPEIFAELKIPDFPLVISCNVCSKEKALQNILRKHGESGSWNPLERDIFLHKFMNVKKSIFLVIEESTGIISNNPHLNVRFVRDEIFNSENLKKLGFTVREEQLYSTHDSEESKHILSDISKKIEKKEITTRKNRGQIIEVLDPSTQRAIDKNSDNKTSIIIRSKNLGNNLSNKNDQTEKTEQNSEDSSENNSKKASLINKRLSKRTSQKTTVLFGGKLYLVKGETSDLYRDIVDLHAFYSGNKERLSFTFPSLIRMSLRLLCETAAKEHGKSMDNYLQSNFAAAKGTLDKDLKTLLSNHSIDDAKIVQLLHTGAHSYKASTNIEQTLALSIIIGAILTITHGQEQVK